jgi:hypothetical protein
MSNNTYTCEILYVFSCVRIAYSYVHHVPTGRPSGPGLWRDYSHAEEAKTLAQVLIVNLLLIVLFFLALAVKQISAARDICRLSY